MKNRKVIIIAGIAAALLVGIFLLQASDKTPDGKTNSIRDVGTIIADKTYKTKEEAYKSFANEKDAFYNRPAKAFESRPETAAQSPEPTAQQPQATASQVRHNSEFDRAYKEVQANIDGIYNKAPAAQAQQQPTAPVETQAERRRKAMQRDWQQPTSGNTAQNRPTMYRAVIHGSQVIRSGQAALFRTKDPIYYGTLTVPVNTLLSGITSITDNRLTVKITSVRLNHEVYALPLEIFGSDGMAGIPLNYDAVSKIANSQATSTSVQEAGSALSRYGGTIGRVAGSLASGIGNQVQSTKSAEIKLIDNQSVILKIAEQ